MTIPGFSFISALALLSDIADIKSFPTAKKFCFYLRVAPKIQESNKSPHIGHINKQGLLEIDLFPHRYLFMTKSPSLRMRQKGAVLLFYKTNS